MANNMLQSLLFSGVSSGGSSGGDGGVLVVHDEDGTLDKTWKEIHDAPLAVLKVQYEAVKLVSGITVSGGTYVVAFGDLTYFANSEDGYPNEKQPK